jgi:hypothetical protein
MAATRSSNHVAVGTDTATVESIQHTDQVKIIFFLQIPGIF